MGKISSLLLPLEVRRERNAAKPQTLRTVTADGISEACSTRSPLRVAGTHAGPGPTAQPSNAHASQARLVGAPAALYGAGAAPQQAASAGSTATESSHPHRASDRHPDAIQTAAASATAGTTPSHRQTRDSGGAAAAAAAPASTSLAGSASGSALARLAMSSCNHGERVLEELSAVGSSSRATGRGSPGRGHQPPRDDGAAPAREERRNSHAQSSSSSSAAAPGCGETTAGHRTSVRALQQQLGAASSEAAWPGGPRASLRAQVRPNTNLPSAALIGAPAVQHGAESPPPQQQQQRLQPLQSDAPAEQRQQQSAGAGLPKLPHGPGRLSGLKGGWGKVAAVAGPSNATPAANRAANTLLSELQSRDEYSLVAAARVRQNLLSNQPEPKPKPRRQPGALQSHHLSFTAPAGSSLSGLLLAERKDGNLLRADSLQVGASRSMSVGGARGEDGGDGSLSPQRDASIVHALALRFGTAMQAPDDAAYLSYEYGFKQRTHMLSKVLQQGNPAAFLEEAASAAEALYRADAERAKRRLEQLMQEPTTQEGPNQQLAAAVRDLHCNRPFFLVPLIPKEKVERPFFEKRNSAASAVQWSPDKSIFLQRKKDNEARDLHDTDKVKQQQFTFDWQRIVAKTRFRRLVQREDKGVKQDVQRLEEELGEIRQELAKQADLVRSLFTFYSMTSGAMDSESILALSLGQWLAFCADGGIVESGSRGSTVQDMQTIFIAVNFEEESQGVEADANDDDAMVRFEFLEGLVRCAFGKYIASRQMSDASDAVGRLLEELREAPGLPPEALQDANVFRRERFYNAAVEVVLKDYWELLQACFKLYKAKDRSKFFWIEHWVAFLEANHLMGLHTGVERREVKLIYAWSQSIVSDELRRRRRAVSLSYWDFIEAVARLADLISPPPMEWARQYLSEQYGIYVTDDDHVIFEYYKHVGDAGTTLKRESAELVCTPSRPLADKLALLLQYLTLKLREAWGGKDHRDTAAKMTKMATYLSGGIEMG